MNANNINPLFLNPEMLNLEPPVLPLNPQPEPRKPGPARAWPKYRTDWNYLMDIEPHADSPLHE